MKKIKTKNTYIPNYANGSDLLDISKYLRAQISGYQPTEIPKGVFASSYLLQGGALGSQLLGLAGQRTQEDPFIPNPSTVNDAFRKTNPNDSLSPLKNLFQGQQRDIAMSSASQGASAYDIGNILAKPMANAGRAYSEANMKINDQNAQLDRSRAGFDIETQGRIQAAQSQQNQNDNQKLAMITGKISEGFGAFGNLNNETFLKKQQVEQMNNAKLSQLMNQLFTVNYLNNLYKK